MAELCCSLLVGGGPGGRFPEEGMGVVWQTPSLEVAM